MSQPTRTRREFITTASTIAAAAVLPTTVRAVQQAKAGRWPIGSHTRPFAGFRASQAANPDSDADGVPDVIEIATGTNPNVAVDTKVRVRAARPGSIAE